MSRLRVSKEILDMHLCILTSIVKSISSSLSDELSERIVGDATETCDAEADGDSCLIGLAAGDLPFGVKPMSRL